jgi:hypothetical protein
MIEKFIAIDGHVIQFKVEPMAGPPLGLFVGPERIGLNEATTFFGFCDKHDSELFRPLEATEFTMTPQQIALLGYRAICRDLYGKESEIAANDAMRLYVALNPDIPGFEAKNAAYQIQRAARVNARKNYQRARDLFAGMLNPETQNSLRYFGIVFRAAPVYLAAASFLPEWDFNGTQLQDLGGLDDFYPICFSAWAKDGMSAVVFSWHESADHICAPFIESLRESRPSRIANRVLSMAFEYSENIVFRGDWWDRITEIDRQRLANRVMSGVEDTMRHAGSLLDDGLRALPSEVLETRVSAG